MLISSSRDVSACSAHCLDGVDDQVEDHLLQLHPVSLNERQTLRECCRHRDAVLRRLATGQRNDLEDRVVDRHALPPCRRLLDEGTDPADDVARSLAVLQDTTERLPDLLEIRRLGAQPAQSRIGVGDRRRDRLVDLMGNRGRELPHGRDAIRVRQLHLHLAVAPLALACFCFRPLALGQIEHEGDTLVPAFFEGRRAEQHGHTAAVLPEVLLLERLQAPALLVLFHQPRVAVAPFRRRQICPAYATGDEILAVVSHHTEKRVIGLENLTFEIPNEDPDDVGVDQAPDLRFAFCEIAVQAGILQRDRGLRGEQLQHRAAGPA